MKFKRRKILFLFFIILFFLISFMTVVYAQGYKIKFTWPISFRSLQKTGQLTIETNPPGADIYINNKKLTSFWKKYLVEPKKNTLKTPNKLRNLFPGTYTITLKLDGYHNIERKIQIYSGKITFLSNIEFFKNTLPLKIGNSSFDIKNISPNKKYIISKNGQNILYLENEEKFNIGTTSKANIIWSDDSDKFIINDKLYSLENLQKEEFDLSKIIGNKIENLRINNNKIYYYYKNSLHSFDLNNNQNKKILSELPQDYLIKEDKIFIIYNEKNRTFLTAKKIETNKIIRTIELPYSNKYYFVLKNHNLLNIYNSKYQTLNIINIDSSMFPMQKTINNIKYFEWKNNNELLYANDFEIWKFDLKNYKQTIITRISEKINGIIIHPIYNNIIYWTKSDIIMLKYQNDKINIINLAKMKILSDISIQENGKNLYFNGKAGDQSGIYKLNIR